MPKANPFMPIEDVPVDAKIVFPVPGLVSTNGNPKGFAVFPDGSTHNVCEFEQKFGDFAGEKHVFCAVTGFDVSEPTGPYKTIPQMMRMEKFDRITFDVEDPKKQRAMCWFAGKSRPVIGYFYTKNTSSWWSFPTRENTEAASASTSTSSSE